VFCQDVDPEAILDMVLSRALSNFVFDLRDVVLQFERNSAPSPGSILHSRLINAGITIIDSSSQNDLDE
jgi:hypothetical protein